MMHSFAQSKQTAEVIEEQFKMKPEEFDKQFLAWLDKRVKGDGRQVSGMAEADEGTSAPLRRARTTTK